MITLSAGLETKRRTPEGTSPVVVLKIKFATGDLYVGDRAFTITAWGGGDRTVRGWVDDWSAIADLGAQEFEDTPIVVSSFSLPVAVPGGRTATDTLFSRIIDPANAPKQTVVELYAWDTALDAATDPPTLIWAGTIVDWPWTNEDTLDLQLVDPRARLDKAVGTEITTALFSGADERALGLIVPIPFGTVRNAPALPVAAAAHNAMGLDAAVGATTIYCSNVNEQPAFPASGTLRINGADVAYSAKSTGVSGGITYRTFTVTALVKAVSRGALVLEKKTNNDYVIAPYAVKQVDNYYADGVRIAGSLVSSGGYDFLRFTTHPLELMAAALAAAGASGVSDTIAVNDTIGVSDTIGVTNDMATFLEQLKPTSQVTGAQTPAVDGNIWLAAFAASSSPTEQLVVVTFDAFAASGTGATEYKFGLALEAGGIVGAYTYCFTFTNTIGVMPRTISCTLDEHVSGLNRNVYMSFSRVSGAVYTFTYTLATVMKTVKRAGVTTKTGSASKTGAASKIGTVALTGGAAVITGTDFTEQDLLNMQVTWDGGGAKDDVSGTFTGSASALIDNGRDVIKWFEYTFEALPVANFATAPGLATRHGTTFKLDGVIQEKEPARRIAARMAFQIGCRLQFLADLATLWDFRRTFAPARIIQTNALRLLAGDRVSAKPRNAPDDWILNKIALLYDPDPMIADERTRYRKNVAEADTASQTANGIKERAQLMRFHYVRSDTTAAAVAKLYQQVFGPRREFNEFGQYLDGLGLQAGDPVLVVDKMTGYAPGILLSAGYHPGNGGQDRAPEFDFLLLMIREGTLVFTTEAHTTSDMLTSPADEPVIHTNLGAVGAVTLTLPAAEVGMVFVFAVAAAQTLNIDPSGTEIFTTSFTDASATSPVGSVALADQAAGKMISLGVVGATLKVRCNIAGKWMITEKIGAWDVEV